MATTCKKLGRLGHKGQRHRCDGQDRWILRSLLHKRAGQLVPFQLTQRLCRWFFHFFYFSWINNEPRNTFEVLDVERRYTLLHISNGDRKNRLLNLVSGKISFHFILWIKFKLCEVSTMWPCSLNHMTVFPEPHDPFPWTIWPFPWTIRPFSLS